MPKEKKLWKKYETLIVAIVALALIYALILFNQKINFLLGNELIVYLQPPQKQFNMHYGELEQVYFNVSIDNAAYCSASCYYSFTDRSRNQQIDNNSFYISKGQHFANAYNLTVKRLGSGQDIYNFDVRCHSIRSFLCLTKGAEKARSSLVTVNYDLTETEKKLKDGLKGNFTILLKNLAQVDVLRQKTNQKMFDVGFRVNLNTLTKQKISIDDYYDKTRISIENLRSFWSIEDYNTLNSKLNDTFFASLEYARKSMNELDSSIDAVVHTHNKILSELRLLHIRLKETEAVIEMVDSDELLNNLAKDKEKFNFIASSVVNNTFESYGMITQNISSLAESANLTAEKSKVKASLLLFGIGHNLKFEKDMVCSLAQDCQENVSIGILMEKTRKFLESYPNTTPIKQSCDEMLEFNQTYLHARNDALTAIAEKNISFSEDENFLELANRFKENEAVKLNNSYYEHFETIKSENLTDPDIIEIAGKILPKKLVNATELDYNQSLNLSLYLLSKSGLTNESLDILKKCQVLEEPLGNAEFDFDPISVNTTYSIVTTIDTTLSDNSPICCVFNDCNPCCREESCKNDPKTFPIIFLHGHSLAKDNSPEFSLDSFNKLQFKLQEDGYLNAGIISLYSQNEASEPGVWGLSGKPVTVKASYYYDAFRKEDKYIIVPTKSENIDTYALRLRDLIGIVKERTSKPKVNIIAHSMGGLVARRYIQIFGGEDIDKLIMIATPNNGISGSAGSYCGIIGENRECLDMQENSIFLSKLNDPSQQPTKVKQHMIIGQGCSTNGKDGDGVVFVENAKLENASLYYVNGTCKGLFGNVLHTEILNIEEYPETYLTVKRILKG